MTSVERTRWSSKSVGDALWMEDMLSYCTNILSQIADLSVSALKDDSRGFVDLPVTTGPEDSPDEYDVSGLLKEIRTRRPLY